MSSATKPVTKFDPARALAIGAGLVIIALTAAAFWLSYAHLAEVALGHGLGDAEVRAWAWPACLDLFIVAGEIMWLRAALSHRVDLWAIALTVIGSGGSIALNVAGVGSHADPLNYVVAAVPPTAALLAFGALMRQVHQALAGHVESPKSVTDQPVIEAVVERVEVPMDTRPEVTDTPPAEPQPAILPAAVSPLVICGDRKVWPLVEPSRDDEEGVSGEQAERLPTEAAANVIRAAWVMGTPVAETARQATRSTSYVKKVFARLEETRTAEPAEREWPALEWTEVSA